MHPKVAALSKALVGHLAYLVCERLEGMSSRRTTGTMNASSEAIVAYAAIDWQRALADRATLPPQIAAVMATFSDDEWRTVMSDAKFSGGLVQFELRGTEYQRLRAEAQ